MGKSLGSNGTYFQGNNLIVKDTLKSFQCKCFFQTSLGILHLDQNVALLRLALYDEYELAREEFHLWLGEWFERGGIAIASCLEGSCARDLEGQLIIN